MKERTAPTAGVDYAGAALMTLGLAAIVGAFMHGPDRGFTSPVPASLGIAGILLLVAFVLVENRVKNALLPPGTFASRQFVGVNGATFAIYAALAGLFFLLMLQLQNVLGYSALEAGASLMPINVLLLVISPIAGRLAERLGPRMPMAGGALVAAVGMMMFALVRPGATYWTSVLPAAVVFGLGLGSLVAPLTTVALASLGEKRAGLASAVNNSVARLAGLLATAIIPMAAGLGHNARERIHTRDVHLRGTVRGWKRDLADYDRWQEAQFKALRVRALSAVCCRPGDTLACNQCLSPFHQRNRCLARTRP